MQKITNNYERKKLFLLSFAACLIAASYAILRPLKISLFYQVVGKEYYPLSKFLLVIFSIPFVAGYSKLIDKYKKHIVLYILFSVYFGIGLIFSLFFLQSNPHKLSGWAFTMLMDFYPTFVIGTFWAFINSTSTPNFAKTNYGTIYSFVKIGSLLATISSFFFLIRSVPKNFTYFNFLNNFINFLPKIPDNYLIPGLISIASFLTLISLIFIMKINKQIPKNYLDGYKKENSEIESDKQKKTWGMLQGLKLMLTKPYVFGIFLLFYLYDVIFTIVEYQATILLSIKVDDCANYISAVLFLSAFISQLVGLFTTIFITPKVLKSIKLKHSLLIMPIFTASLVLLIIVSQNLLAMLSAMILLPALNFGLNSPIREILFIPTIKDIQFKSKAWIDSFGRTLSKTSGSTINMLFYQATLPVFLVFNTVFSLILTTVWGLVSYSIGKKCEKIIDKNRIIGKS